MAKIVLEIQAKNKEATQSVQLLNTEVKTLSKTLSSISVNKDLTAQIKALTANYKEMGRVVQNTLKLETQQVNNQAKQQRIIKQSASQIKTLEKHYADLLNTIKSLEKNYPKGTFDSIKTQTQHNLKAVQGLTEGTADYDKQVQELTAQLQNLQTQLSTTRAETKSTHGSLKDITSGFLKFQLSAMLVMKPLQMIRSALSSINETLVKTEDAVISLQRVLPSGSASDSEISSRLYKIAQDYGQTFENVQQIATNFARTGMSWADTIKATEAAVLALNVAELDAQDASDGLISILTQFGKTTSDLTEVVDKLNKAADNNPVTTEKLLKALQRTGAAAKNANIELDDTIGIITTLSKATNRSGENLGTAVNSLIQFSSKSKSLETFAKLGGDVETAVEKYRAGAGSILEIWQELGKVIQDRKSNAESILGGGLFGDDEWDDINEELKEALGESYADITDIYDTASTFRKNYFIALLNDMDNVKKVANEIADAQGYSQAENQKYLDTYTAKLNTLKAQWEDIANSEQGILGIKKAFVDLGSALLNVLQWTGGLRTVLIGVGAALATLFTPKIISGLSKIGNFFKNLSNPLKNFKTATQAATKAQQAQTLATNLQARADDAATTAKKVRNTSTSTAAAIESAEAVATHTQTIATQAQARADELAAIAAKAKAAAIQTTVGIIGFAISAASILVGVIQSAAEKRKQEAEEARRQREETIANWEAIKEEAVAFAELNNQYNELKSVSDRATDQEKEFLTVQEKIVETLGYKAIALKKLTEGTEEYQLKLEELTQNEIQRYALQAQNAANAARDNWIEDNLSDFFKWRLLASSIGRGYGYSFGDTIDVSVSAVDNYESLLQTMYDEGAGNTEAYNVVYAVYDKLKKSTETYLTTQAQSEAWKYILQNGAPQNQEDINSIVDTIIKATGATEKWRDTIEGVVVELTGFKTPKKEVADWANDISKVASKYDDLIKKLEELRDLNKEAYDWEEKKLAVLEAEQALENARNEATVRRYNQTTGQWEWQTDEKAIKEAEENLQKAQIELERGAYDNIISQLEKGDATNESILAILQEVAPLLGADSEFVTAVTDAFKEKTGVDITQPKKSYDSGGIANGLGFMPKATSQPETVNNPDLTTKILSPVSNAQFDRYVRDMGIMFETARQYSQRPVFERTIGNYDNSVNNSGQINFAGGLTVGADKRGSSIDEMLSMFGIVPNN